MGALSSVFGNALQGAKLKPVALLPPTGFTSEFVVDTILGQLNWTDTNAGTAQYEVYSVTNEAEPVLLATTEVGVTSYQDSTCKQNASVIYSIRAKKESELTDLVAATELATPLCLKTNQAVLTQVVINLLNIEAGKYINIDWGDNTNNEYSGANSDITKDYLSQGVKNIRISGDTDFIEKLACGYQSHLFGSITNLILPSKLTWLDLYSTGITGSISDWILPNTLTTMLLNSTAITGSISDWILPNTLVTLFLYSTGITGSISDWIIPANLTSLRIYSTGITGSIPKMAISSPTKGLNYQAQSCNLSDSSVTVFRKAMSVFNISNQKVTYVTANIDKLLKAIADFYEFNPPTSNCTYTLSGANMGIPTGGASNADITRLVGYYTSAGSTCTIFVRTS